MNIKDYMSGLGQQAKAAGRELSRADSGKKNSALLAIAEQLASQTDYLVAENAKDLQAGKRKRSGCAPIRTAGINAGQN
jgi:glutamate-5-semialdehyde dehydrogenase (EC 1.2.1.41)